MSAAASEAVSAQTKLLKLTRKRLEKYATLLTKVLISGDPETVHDLRVWSRRLQQALRVIAPPTGTTKKILRELRKVRQTLGPYRDLDVILELLRSRQRQSSTATVQEAWEAMQGELASQRQELVERVRREIAAQDLFKFITRAQSLIAATDRDFNPVAQLTDGITKSMAAWEDSLAATRQQPDAAGLHALRIAGKKLRYRVELLSDLDPSKVKPLVKSLKEIQTNLGIGMTAGCCYSRSLSSSGGPAFWPITRTSAEFYWQRWKRNACAMTVTWQPLYNTPSKCSKPGRLGEPMLQRTERD